MSAIPSLAAFGAGVASHLLYFKHGEHHHYSIRYIQAFFALSAIAVVARVRLEQIPVGLAITSTAILDSIFLAGLYSSLLIWRIFFNPLNKIPGPFGARISRIGHLYSNRNADRHRNLRELHEKYGSIVRIDPNAISVIDPDGVQVTSGQHSTCIKAAWYDMDYPLISLHTDRNRASHDRRRRIWSPAFSDKALRGYEIRIQKYNDMLMQHLDRLSGQPTNICKWVNCYSFDVMGDLGFGQSFGCLETGELHWAINLLNEGMAPAGLGIPDWLLRVLLAVPGATAGYYRFVSFCCQRLDDRLKKQGKSDLPDITHTLIEDYEKNATNKKAALSLLYADTRLIIVAGSDTTASTLAHIFFFLAANPEIQQRLRDEVESCGSELNHLSLKDAELLNGCIWEALRISPPVPSGVYRKTPKEGVHIGETYIPGDTVIQMPQYVIGHDESIYPQAEKFIPERWSSRPDLVKNKDAFQPFSLGPYNCIGKNVAYTELRTLTAQLVRRYDVKLAPGETGQALLTQSTDHFTLGLPPCELIFTKR